MLFVMLLLEARAVRDAWAEWSLRHGLKENADKTAIFHATAAGQRSLRAVGVEPAMSPKILGVEPAMSPKILRTGCRV